MTLTVIKNARHSETHGVIKNLKDGVNVQMLKDKWKIQTDYLNTLDVTESMGGFAIQSSPPIAAKIRVSAITDQHK